MARDLVLQARLAMVRSSLSTVRRVLADLDQVRHLGADGATTAEVDELLGKIDWAVSAIRDAKSSGDCSHEAELVARELEDFLKARRARVTSTRPRLTLQETDVDDDLGDEVEDRLNELQVIEQLLSDASGGGNDHLTAAWLSYASWSAACLKVFRDYVDLVRGVLLRDSGLDNDLCRIADKLVQAKWSGYHWHSFTIPASEDHGDVSSLRLVRMGFPEWSVWALPLAMYEMGHLFAEINRKVRPLVEAAREHATGAAAVSLARDDVTSDVRDQRTARAGEEAAARCETWIADAYATARLGPAYVWATVLLRADPASDADNHRVALMLEMLRLVDESAGDRPNSGEFDTERDRLREEWSAARAQVTGNGEMVVPDAHMQAIVKEVKSRITVAFGPADWDMALKIAEDLEHQDVRPSEIAVHRDVTHLQHILNGAWKARIRLADDRFKPAPDRSPEQLADDREAFAKRKLADAHRLAERARDVCLAIIDGTASGEPSASSPTVTAAPRSSPVEPSIDKTRSVPTGAR